MKPTGQEFERAARDLNADRAHLRLFVAGMAPRSTQAVADAKRLRARYRCCIEIIDIYKQPSSASSEQIIAVPTLARAHPPQRRVIGTIQDIDRVALVLGLKLAQRMSDE